MYLGGAFGLSLFFIGQAQTDIQNGKTIKAEGKVKELLQEALERPVDSSAHQTASELTTQLETALTELRMDVFRGTDKTTGVLLNSTPVVL